tara:strand:+ start:1944 stop:2492 length:549 start_codon:yes stop_codon:yes gene_type:complete
MNNIDIAFLTEIIGYTALFFGLLSFQFKSGKKILALQAVMCFFWYSHYALSGAYVGAFMAAVGFFRNGLACVLPDKYIKKLAIISSIIALAIGFSVAESYIYLTAMFGTLLNNVSVLKRNKPAQLRIFRIISEFFWLTYSISVLSVPGMIFGISLISSNIIGFFRHEKDFIRHYKAGLIQKN